MNTPSVQSPPGSRFVSGEELDSSGLVEWLSGEDHLYALLDACDEPRIPPKIASLGQRAVCLYRGAAAREHAFIAPYLARVDNDMVDWILEYLAETPWGYFVSADTDSLEDVRKHFRKFLLVKGPEGEELYFRFYDPRCLPTFLNSSTQEELDAFFGSMKAFATASMGKFQIFRKEQDSNARKAESTP